MPETAEAPVQELTTAERRESRDRAQKAVLIHGNSEPVKKIIETISGDSYKGILEGLEVDGKTMAPRLRTLVDKIGVRYDDDGNMIQHRNGPQDGAPKREGKGLQEYQRANTALGILLPILESGGYDQMTQQQQSELRNKLSHALQDSDQFPDFRGLSTGDKKAAVESMLRNPKAKEILVKEVLEPILKMPITSEADILEAAKQKKLSEVTKEGSEQKKQLTTDDVSAIIRKLDNLRNSQDVQLSQRAETTRRQIKPFDDRLTTLRSEQQQLQQSLQDAITNQPQPPTQNASPTNPWDPIQNQQEWAQWQYVNNLNQGNQNQNAQIAVQQHRDTLQQHSLNIQRIESLIQENMRTQDNLLREITQFNMGWINEIPTEEEVQEKRDTSLPHATTASKEAVEAEFDEKIKNVEYHDLMKKRSEEETAISLALQHGLPQAFEQFAAEAIEEATKVAREQMGEENDEKVKKAKDAFMREIETRWRTTVTRKKHIFGRAKTDRVISDQKVNNDWQVMMNDGLKPIMQNIFTSLPAWADLSEDQRKDLLKNDTLQQEFLKPLIANRILTRGLQPGEVQQLTDMEQVRDAIEGAIEKNEKYRELVDRLVGTGDLKTDPKNFYDRYRATAGSNPGLFTFSATLFGVVNSIWRGIIQWGNEKNDPRQNLISQITTA